MLSKHSAKGFTLIELIITISILAILVTVLIVAINPAEQLSRSRDAKRTADLDALKSAITLYIAQATTTVNLDGGGTANTLCIGGSGEDTVWLNTSQAVTTATGSPSTIVGAGRTTSTGLKVATGSTATAAISWMPALLGQTPGGPAISTLPADPSGTAHTTNYYSYTCDIGGGALLNFELNAKLESAYFQTDLDIDGTDGGQSATKYEVGTDPGLDLL